MRRFRFAYHSIILILFLPLLFLLFGCVHPQSLSVDNGAAGSAFSPDQGSTASEISPETADDAVAADAAYTEDNDAGEQVESSQETDTASAPVAQKGTPDDEQSLLDTALDLTETAQEYWEESDMDRALDSLDQAYALILKVPGSNEKYAQQKEDLRFVISKRIMEMYAARQTTVNGTSAAIPMTVNDHVMREIQSFQTVERDFFVESYKRSGRYRPAIVKALKEAGIPKELSWLPLIESGFKVRALSRSRALGLWQFIPSTGYKFGLKRNAWIDERLDPEKATSAAIAYLKELHSMFGDWATVLAAYNCGEGSVSRVIRDQKINYLDNFWDFYERLPRETARYFPRFLAVLAILKDPAKYGFDDLGEADSPLSYETVTIDKPVRLSSISQQMNIDPDELTTLNPELRRSATPNTPYSLKVPSGTGETVLACLDKLPKWSPPKVHYVFHRVRRGETLSFLALRYRTSIRKILEINNLRRAGFIRVGQRLKIPTRSST